MEQTPTMPTLEQLQKKYKAYENYYSTLHSQQKEIDKYYELTFDPEVPSIYDTYMPPTAREWIDTGVRYFTLDNPKARVFPREDSDDARDQAALLEVLYNFWLRQSIYRIKRAAKKILKRGEIFLKLEMDDTFFGSDSPERAFYFPLNMLTPDPINVYPSPAHVGLIPVEVFESFNITAAEAQALADRNGWNWKTKKNPNTLVKWWSYYCAYWRCFMMDERPVFDPPIQPNILGICPYVHIDAGAGDEHYEGKPEYLYRSLLWGKRDLFKMEARVLSVIDALLQRYGYPRYKAKGEQSEVDRLYPHGIPTSPDEWLRENDQVEVEVIKGEQPPPELFSQYAMVKTQAQVPEVLSGIRPSGVYSSQHQETLVATAKPHYKEAFKNLEDALGILMGMGARTLEKVYKSPLQIKNFSSSDGSRKYSTITPNDIAGHYDCEVELLAEPPEATDTRKALGRALRVAGSISELTELMEYHNKSRKEAEDEMAQKAAELILRDPAMREVVAKAAMGRLGMERNRELMEEIETEANKSLQTKPPPKQIGQKVTTGSELVRQRGRSTELEPQPTLQGQRVTRE